MQKYYKRMTGQEYINNRELHPFWDASRDPNREDVADAFEQGKAEGHNEANREFITGVWFAIDHLVRYEDQPSMAVEIANAAGISRKQARHLWEDSDLEDCDGENRMTWFLDNENFAKNE